jgi:hypothetical protein
MRRTPASAPGPRRLRTFWLAGPAVTVAAAALSLSAVPSATTAATWTDADNASGSFQALTVPAPIIDSCTAQSILVNLSLRPRVTITWHYPTTGYTTANAQYSWSATGLANLAVLTEGNGVSTTGPVAGVYTSTFQGGLLSGLLGASADIGISTGHPSGWVSKKSTAHATFPLLVGTGTCTITNAS